MIEGVGMPMNLIQLRLAGVALAAIAITGCLDDRVSASLLAECR
jgi:hypothetical protein